MVWKLLVTDIFNFGPFSLKPSNKLILQANLKEVLSIGLAVTIHAGYIKLMFKILDFYSVKTYVCVCLHMYIYVGVYVDVYPCKTVTR